MAKEGSLGHICSLGDLFGGDGIEPVSVEQASGLDDQFVSRLELFAVPAAGTGRFLGRCLGSVRGWVGKGIGLHPPIVRQ